MGLVAILNARILRIESEEREGEKRKKKEGSCAGQLLKLPRTPFSHDLNDSMKRWR